MSTLSCSRVLLSLLLVSTLLSLIPLYLRTALPPHRVHIASRRVTGSRFIRFTAVDSAAATSRLAMHGRSRRQLGPRWRCSASRPEAHGHGSRVGSQVALLYNQSDRGARADLTFILKLYRFLENTLDTLTQ